jgi:ubiquinone/menaquinone biosynthesis C-methylase UbiE
MDVNMVDDPDKSANDSVQWDRKWTTEKYQAKRRANFETVDAYLNQPVGRLLDIGCGFAWESRWFNKKYGTELWLLDGDASTNATKSETASYGNWNTDSDQLKFYHTFDFLNSKLQELGTKNYRLIDANNINIPGDVKFDVITSWLSCGHHYPVKTYIDLMKKHSHENTRIILDIRCKGTATNYIGVDGFEVVNVVSNAGGKKRASVEIKLL